MFSGDAGFDLLVARRDAWKLRLRMSAEKDIRATSNQLWLEPRNLVPYLFHVVAWQKGHFRPVSEPQRLLCILGITSEKQDTHAMFRLRCRSVRSIFAPSVESGLTTGKAGCGFHPESPQLPNRWAKG